jgi:outer membrane protein TolC
MGKGNAMNPLRASVLSAAAWLLLGLHPAGAELNLADYQEIPGRQFVQEALMQDPEFNQALQTYLKAQYGQLATQAMGAWTLGASAGVLHSKSLGNNLFEPETIDARTYELSVQKLFLETGTRFQAAHSNALTVLAYPEQNGGGGFPGFDSSLFVNTSTQTSTPEVALSLVQPLLRNAFGLADRFPLQAAELQAQAAELDVQEAWENRLERLYGYYLSWVAAQEAVLAFRKITTDLQRVEEQVSRRVQAGVTERSDLLRTRENILRNKSRPVAHPREYFKE